MSRNQVADKFGISRTQDFRIRESRFHLQAAFDNDSPPTALKIWKAKHPVVDDGLKKFEDFVRSEHILISMNEIQKRARMIAVQHGITQFKASRGWVQKYISSSGIKNSLRLHEK